MKEIRYWINQTVKYELREIKMGKSAAEIQAEINDLDQKIQQGGTDGNRASDAQLNVWEMQKAQYKVDLKSAQESEAANQAKVEQIVGLKETLSTIFEATFPKEETVLIIGLSEYESTQQTFNQLIDQAVDEDQNAVYSAFNEQLAAKDETIRQLKQEALDADQTANEMNTKIGDLTEANGILTADNGTLTRDNEDLSNQLQQQKDANLTLQKQLNNVPAPQIIDITPTAPSESLSDKIAQAKANSKLQLANVKAISANWVEGTNPLTGKTQVAHVNDVQEVEIPKELPLISEEPAATANDFRSSDTATESQPVALEGTANTQQTSGDNAEPAVKAESAVITLESINERLKAVEAQLNIPAAA